MQSTKRRICFVMAIMLCTVTIFGSFFAINANAAYIPGGYGSSQWPLTPDDPNAGKEVRKGFEDVNFYGKVFRFSGPTDDKDGWVDYEVYAEEGAEGILDASIIERNDILFELYECYIEIEPTSQKTLENDFATNQNRIDIFNGKYNIGTRHTNFYNFYDLEIDLTQPWWDQGIIKDLTVDGHLHAVTGAYSLTSFDATWVMFFNKTVLENNEKLADVDPYELVKNNEWTLDNFYQIIKKAGNEDGDQLMTTGSGDIFGLVSTANGIRGLYFGAGQGYVTKTDHKDGTSDFNHAFTDSAVRATSAIIDIYSDDYTTIANYTTVESQMRGGLTLFAPEVLRMASYYAGKQGSYKDPVEFGILPFPKFSSDQAEYKHYVDNHIIYTCVPKTCADIMRISNFLEVYAYHSYFTVYNDYLNLYKYTYTTDTEAAEMVDIILKSRSFDLAYQLAWRGVDASYISGVQKGNNVIAELRGDLGASLVEAANSYRDSLVSKCAHDYKEIKREASTCSKSGYVQYKCTKCLNFKIQNLPSVPHKYGAYLKYDIDYHEQVCSSCKITSRNLHTWDEGVVTTPSTEENKGVKTYTCTSCGQTKTESLPTIEHTHEYDNIWYKNKDIHWKECDCGKKTSKEEHEYDENNICEICNYRKRASSDDYDDGRDNNISNNFGCSSSIAPVVVFATSVLGLGIGLIRKKKED